MGTSVIVIGGTDDRGTFEGVSIIDVSTICVCFTIESRVVGTLVITMGVLLNWANVDCGVGEA